MKVHELKTDPAVFAAVIAGDKTHEIRLNDRGFAVDDILHLRETKFTGTAMMRDGAPLVYTGRNALREVSHIQEGFGLEDGWVILSFRQGFGRLYDQPLAMPLDLGTPDALYPEYRVFAPAATTQASTAQAEPVITRADVSKAQADAIQGFAESLLEMGIVEQSVHDTAMKIVAHLRSAGDTGSGDA